MLNTKLRVEKLERLCRDPRWIANQQDIILRDIQQDLNAVKQQGYFSDICRVVEKQPIRD